MMANDNLEALRSAIWSQLARGVADRRSPWRTPVLATTSHDGPTARVVVLRRAAPAAAQLSVHTDARSPKMAALACEPRAALVFWHPARREQIRAEGIMRALPSAHPDTAAAWRETPPPARRSYGAEPRPGAPIAAPEDARDAADEATAHAQFRVLVMEVRRIDWLALAEPQHRRAEFTWSATGTVEQARWLAP